MSRVKIAVDRKVQNRTTVVIFLQVVLFWRLNPVILMDSYLGVITWHMTLRVAYRVKMLTMLKYAVVLAKICSFFLKFFSRRFFFLDDEKEEFLVDGILYPFLMIDHHATSFWIASTPFLRKNWCSWTKNCSYILHFPITCLFEEKVHKIRIVEANMQKTQANCWPQKKVFKFPNREKEICVIKLFRKKSSNCWVPKKLGLLVRKIITNRFA